MLTTQNNLPNHSRVWVYQSNREFSALEIPQIQSYLNEFVLSWESHGTLLKGAAEIFYNRFIVFFVDEDAKHATGCSIDKSVTLVKHLEQTFGISLMDRLNLAFRQNQEIKTLKMNEFQNLIKQGLLDDHTIVFNNLVQNKQEFLNNWEVEAKKSWHQNLFLVK
jgi:hypothetical protein